MTWDLYTMRHHQYVTEMIQAIHNRLNKTEAILTFLQAVGWSPDLWEFMKKAFSVTVLLNVILGKLSTERKNHYRFRSNVRRFKGSMHFVPSSLFFCLNRLLKLDLAIF